MGVIGDRIDISGHIEEVLGVARLRLIRRRFERASGGLPDYLREPKFPAIVLIIARGLEIKGGLAEGLRGERATTLERDDRITEIIEIFWGIEELVNEGFESFSGDDNRPSDFFLLIKDIATEDTLNRLLNEAIVAIEVIETTLISIGEQETTNEIANGNLPRAELRFERRFAVSSESMEKDLTISGLNQDIEVRRRENIIRREDPRLFIARDFEAWDARILGRRRVS